LPLLHLDSYYFYAPVPRVLRLKEKLREDDLSNYKLLYIPFSNPQYFIKMLTRTLLGYEIVVISKSPPVAESKGISKRSGVIQVLIQKALNSIVRGRKPKKCIDFRKTRYIDEEKLAIIDFLAFLVKHNDRVMDTLNKGDCSAKPRICLSKNDVKKLRRLSERIEEVVNLVKNQINLYKIYEKYMICRTCKLLGIKYPDALVTINKLPIDYKKASEILTSCPYCSKVCDYGKHADDFSRIVTLMEYLEKNPDRLVIATIESISKSRKGECFSCLTKCISSLQGGIKVI